MERVQFQQEQMLAELKDLVQKSLFTQAEIKQIMKKRTQFETALVRRIAKKSDFLRYAAYEMGLEQLRRKRVERLKLPPSAPSISDYALVRRQFQIFERALKKFKSDVGLWVQYIQVAKREGARALVGRITARALQLHPNTPSLYILAASHELAHHSPSAARSLLQRGLRLNADSIEMWREYIRMEMGFVEGLRRRWNVLGITSGEGMAVSTQEKPMEVDTGVESDELGVSMAADGATGLTTEEQAADKVGDEGEAARQAIMDGAIVQSAVTSAAQALPRIDLFAALETLIRSYPATARLRRILLDHLYRLLGDTLPDDPRAVKMLATRKLGELTFEGTEKSEAEALVDALQNANEQLVAAVKANQRKRSGMGEVYAEFVEGWCRHPSVDESLRLYLIASLQALARQPNASPLLQAAHIRVLLTHNSAAAKKTLKLARKYAAGSSSANVWLVRLDAERASPGGGGDMKAAWESARKSVRGDTSDQSVEKIWLWGLEHWLVPDAEDVQGVYEGLLKESMRDSSLRTVHEMLLLRYTSTILYGSGASASHDSHRRLKSIRRMSNAYLPTARVWSQVFSLEVARGDASDGDLLGVVYENWRSTDGVNAALGWAGWLMDHGRGQEAMKIVTAVMGQLDLEQRATLENQWKQRIDGAGGDDDGDDGVKSDDDR
ncbi:hypothetical protein BV22DRAFT_1008879 [Leucogyrophana mollusca]|uniref:Uncharacterized protein n=1 Tax=Leucogyrophana mollusca TaxID=85980 RepID=A0ACB8BN06_9AGAM|nr:hypothetical protein BV22DRAFT_1008879 [Leucogyrophana mollusca]